MKSHTIYDPSAILWLKTIYNCSENIQIISHGVNTQSTFSITTMENVTSRWNYVTSNFTATQQNFHLKEQAPRLGEDLCN